MTATRIGNHKLWVGDTNDAFDFNGRIICVLENLPDNEPSNVLWIPILKHHWNINRDEEGNYKNKDFITEASSIQLHLVADKIDEYLNNGEGVLIHCAAGQERSPLAVAWWVARQGGSVEEAYEYVKSFRKETIEHLEWLNTT